MGTIKFDFEGDVAIVTGAARGLGRDLAVELGRAGARVVAADIAGDMEGLGYELSDEEDLAETESQVRSVGAEVLAITVDVRREEQVEQMVASALDHFGKVDILVNNAGVYTGAPITELTETQWDAALDVNLKGPFLCSKHVARHLMERADGGRIVTIASASALVGIPNQASYQSSKHGVLGLTRTLALELAPAGATVNAVCPTVAESPMLDYLMTLDQAYFQDVSRLGGASMVFPDVEAMVPRDVTTAVMWLAAEESRYVTGIALPVDGGFTCK